MTDRVRACVCVHSGILKCVTTVPTRPSFWWEPNWTCGTIRTPSSAWGTKSCPRSPILRVSPWPERSVRFLKLLLLPFYFVVVLCLTCFMTATGRDRLSSKAHFSLVEGELYLPSSVYATHWWRLKTSRAAAFWISLRGQSQTCQECVTVVSRWLGTEQVPEYPV